MVAEEFGTLGCFGYSHADDAGSLSDRTITYKDDTYTIESICDRTFFDLRIVRDGADLRDLFTSNVSFDIDGTTYNRTHVGTVQLLLLPSPVVLADSTYTLEITTTAPGAPQNLTATSVSASSIRLNWATPSSIGGSAITGYDYRTSTDGGGTWGGWVAIDNSASLTTDDVEGLTASTTYTVQMRATNSSGAGLYSETADATTTTACGALPEVTTHANGSETLYAGCLLVGETPNARDPNVSDFGYGRSDGLGSLAPNTFAAGSETVRITALRLESSLVNLYANPSGVYSNFSALGTVEELEKRLVLHLDSHTFPFSDGNVTECCSDWPQGTLSWSAGDTVVVRLVRLSEPSAPETLTATAESSTQVTLSWSAPAQSGGADVTGYEYRASTDGATTFGEWTAIENSAGLTSA
ncbi:fibronectin type III domain-containing protein, partial [Candidatus Palauibacter polyketidifaciens]